MLKVKLPKCPYEEDVQMFNKTSVQINDGLNVLVGCNGYGKTTFLHFLEKQCQKEFEIIRFDGRTDKDLIRQRTMDKDITFFAQFFGSSEGEELSLDVSYMAGMLGNATKKSEKKKFLVIFDGVDSGYSIDNIIELKDFFKNTVFPDMKKNEMECYVVISANSFEMANGEDCIDVGTGKHLCFSDYEEYKEFVMKTREIKDERWKDT